jgi:hypothetical protein
MKVLDNAPTAEGNFAIKTVDEDPAYDMTV